MTEQELFAWAADKRLTYPNNDKRGDVPRAVIALFSSRDVVVASLHALRNELSFRDLRADGGLPEASTPECSCEIDAFDWDCPMHGGPLGKRRKI